MVWTDAKESHLLREVYQRLLPESDAATIDNSQLEIIGKVADINESPMDCNDRINEIYYLKCTYFATIGDIQVEWTNPLNENEWDTFYPTVCRSNAPDFSRKHKTRDKRNPREFVATSQGALNPETSINQKTQSTVNDDLIPVDLFGYVNPSPPPGGRPTEGTDKAHLLPKERNEAQTWNYPATAVLGLNMANVRGESVQKAILGSVEKKTEEGNETIVRFPGIRNLLCNILRITNQQNYFDQNCRVFIFPALDREGMLNWQGTGYDAILVCENSHTAQKIGMGTVRRNVAKKATSQNVIDAMDTASLVCAFLGHSILQKSQAEVDAYQKSGSEKEMHAQFRKQKQVPKLSGLFNANKPICRISFGGHRDDQGLHPAPDPMLLTFKSGNNLLRKLLGFRTVAGGAEPPEDDDLSEEGRQQLAAYLELQDLEEREQRHEEIMSLQYIQT